MVEDTDPPRNKVQTVINDRGLGGLGDELEQRWKGEGFNDHSTRELADHFNRTVIQSAIRDADEMPLEGEVENFYRLLTDDEARSGGALQARNRLGEYGIDVADLEDDFVSHQTMYRYLKQHRGIDTSSQRKTTAELIESTRQSLLRLNSRTQSVTTQNLEQFRQRKEFTLGDFDILVNIQVSCNDCGTRRELTKLLAEEGCDCDLAVGSETADS